MGTIWELDRKSSPYPFKKIRNFPWEHGCTTQLALLTCFIVRGFFLGPATRIGASHVRILFLTN
jgi:hypothetical protein